MARLNEEDLKKIVSRRGYGLASGIKSGISGGIAAGAAAYSDNDPGAVDHLESGAGHGSLHEKKLQVGYAGKVRIRVTFYRRRLADYGEECSRAVSEKALVDCLVYAGLIEGDSGKEIWLEDGGQKKVESNEEEKTEFDLLYEEVNYENPWVPARRHLGH
jgi:hypothetical protein